MNHIVSFNDEQATSVPVVGGKGANLGLLTAAGLSVPPGFVISTSAYTAFIEANGLQSRIDAKLDSIDYEDVTALESVTAEIRALIEGTPFPAEVNEQVSAAYSAMGKDSYVAVRSSGTAEDTEGSSFAGLHDTYLDIKGIDAIADAVRRCWASMWSARATSYRKSQGFDHATATIAVVIQEMVEAEVSGVMFTANPRNARTDEIVINASWGLGEAIVSSLVTPDEFTLDLNTLKVKDRLLGAKEKRIVRGPVNGTVEQEVSEEDRNRYSLDEDQLADLGDLGRRIMRHYGGLPQDIEWAYTGGSFYVLQSRPVTGVEFLWEDALEARAHDFPENPDTLWTYKWSEMYWTGGVTPLFYSVRGRNYQKGIEFMVNLAGFENLKKQRYMMWHRGVVYYNVDYHKQFAQDAIPKFAREPFLNVLPESWVPESASRPLDLKKFLRTFVSMNAAPGMGYVNFQDAIREFIDTRVEEADGLQDKEIARLSDEELKRYAFSLGELQREFCDPNWVGFNIVAPQWFALLGQMLGRWYKGSNPNIFADLISGLPQQTYQSKELHELHALAKTIRDSATLSASFQANPGAAFFEKLPETLEGRHFQEQYAAFISAHGHRGHADRDMYYTRRAEDPALDYEALRALLAADDPTPPWELEARLVQKRKEATEEIHGHIRAEKLGKVKLAAFEFVHEQVLKFLTLREDWRHYADRITFAKRKAYLEVARRAVERGGLQDVDDAFFLTDVELYEVLAGNAQLPLVRAKVENRRRAHHRVDSRQESPAVYLRGRTPIEMEAPPGDAGLTGIGLGSGTATGRVRIVPDLRQIGRVEKGDILVCNATDPGWSPVFTLIKGLIIETGGMLAHGACLSREHGIPALQLRDAMRILTDGDQIEIHGETGQIRVLESSPDAGRTADLQPA